jgi:hypothetical protein
MSIEAIAPSLLHVRPAPLPHASRDGINWPFLLLFWAAISAFFVVRAIVSAPHVPLIGDTDDAMRLVVVRDFLAGQNWFDHLQYRMNTPFGAELHWSRLVDLPIAAMILLFRPFAGDFAETLTLYAWPLLLLLLLLWQSAALTTKLVGREGLLPALALPILSPAVWPQFSPGRLDHHSIQILLTLVLVRCSIAALTRPRWAAGAGIAAATGLAIGAEALPAAVSAVLVFGVLWVVRPECARALRSFGLSFAGAALVHLVIAQPSSAWFAPACDALSIVYVAAAAGVGAAFALLSLLPSAPRWSALGRFAAAGLAGLAVLGGLYTLYPDCFRGPYAALDPWLVTNWLDRISEATPLLAGISRSPDLALGLGAPPLLGLAILVWRVVRGSPARRSQWLVLGAYLAVADMIMLLQVRGAHMAMPLAVPAGAWLIVRARQWYLRRGGVAGVAALVGTWLAFAGVAVMLIVHLCSQAIAEVVPGADEATAATAAPETVACLLPSAFTGLAQLPVSRIMAPIDLGSHLLLFTPHSVVAAPYHRNQQGVRDAFEFFNRPIGEARAILQRRGIDLVVVCPGMPELMGLPDTADDSFGRLYGAKPLPGWLTPVPLAGTPLQVFRVNLGSGG